MRGFFNSSIVVAEMENRFRLLSEVPDFLAAVEGLRSTTLLSRFENAFRIKTWNIKDLEILTLLAWYLPEELSSIMLISCRERASWLLSKGQIDLEDQMIIHLISENKKQTICYYLERYDITTEEFFGNYINVREFVRILSLVSPVLKSTRRPRKTIRRRGYADHGTYRGAEQTHEAGDYTSEQLQLEAERKLIQDTLDFLRGWLE